MDIADEIANAKIDPMIGVATCECEPWGAITADGVDVCRHCLTPYEQVPLNDIRAAAERQISLVLAAEDWADEYRDSDEAFATLLKSEARLQRVLVEYLRDLSKRVPGYVYWQAYNMKLNQLKAADKDPFDVDVMVQEIPDGEDGFVMKVVFDPIADAAAAALVGAQATYGIMLTDSAMADIINRLATEQTAYLVGKKVDQFGNIVDNPKAKYRISDATRDKIKQSIRNSLNIGEDQAAATKRLQDTIRDPKRAAKIAATEAVNTWQGSQFAYATETGAVAKEWRTIAGACPTCQGNANVGIIAIDKSFPSGHLKPSCHPWDRCGLRYVYQEELDNGN